MSYFIYNNISSQKYGILERCPVPPPAVRKTNKIEVPNKIESMTIHLNQYEDITLNCILGLKSKDIIRSAYSWLTGKGELILSSDVNEKYIVKNITVSPEYLSVRFAKLNISFVCSPFAYALKSDPIDITSATDYIKITNNGSIFCEPLIKFKPTTDIDEITINTNGENLKITIPQSVKQNGYNVTVDSALQIVYYIDSDGKYINILPDTYGDIPLLHTGDNYIRHSGGVISMNIKLNERWL